MTDYLQRAQRVLQQRLESLQRAGLEFLPRPTVSPIETTKTGDDVEPASESPAPIQNTALQEPKTLPTPASSLFSSDVDVPTLPRAERETQLEILQNEVCQCLKCEELANSRTQTVFGVGNPEARLVFFGEAPGADEDRQGEPFVGKAGQLLDRIIEACTFQRSEVYIMNVLRCRPPGNRNPSPEEAANCRPFFERQMQLVKPDYICCLGSVAAQTLLETKLSVGRLRGELHAYRWAKVLVTYHPAYLLRNPSAKKLVWADMQILLADMGIEVPKRQ